VTLKFVIVDDASPTPVVLDSNDQRIRLIRREVNGGPAAARNTGIQASRGRYVAFLDDDDLYEPNRLELARAGLRRAPVALCWFNYMGAPASGRILDGSQTGLLAGTVPHLGATAVEASALLSFDESYPAAEDVEWWIRMAGVEVATVPEVGYRIRRHDEIRKRHGTSARISASIRMLEEHSDFFARNRSAEAFRWKRIGLMEAQLGHRRAATAALWRSMRIQPDRKLPLHAARILISGN
jgi:glycosyltransferase involved in cell wall biosynthesis